MKNLLFILFAISTIGCDRAYNSKFFDDCSCNEIEMSNSTVKDSLGHFSVTIPKGNWYSALNLDSNGNGISISDDNSNTIKMFTITELE